MSRPFGPVTGGQGSGQRPDPRVRKGDPAQASTQTAFQTAATVGERDQSPRNRPLEQEYPQDEPRTAKRASGPHTSPSPIAQPPTPVSSPPLTSDPVSASHGEESQHYPTTRDTVQ